ncbi:MAG: 2,3,4,5-tetrahydropyridine-2,6-dicarboxylate N-succinyltransferase [Deltaproteobacteria bacterium]|nr:MAG: 2,3,4,5-tetrahydropyridine-2,6-dicarboxylate N-succinyltransferase [Deltaproteobacteria bacterium]
MTTSPLPPVDDTPTEILARRIEAAFEDRSLLADPTHADAVRQMIARLDAGTVRVAEPDADGRWTVHTYAKQAILLYFGLCSMQTYEVGPFEYHDKIPLKRGFAEAGVRVVPPATVRVGAHLEPGVVLMPSYVNIGARVGARTMVDTWATVGSCAQIGADVHLSGGVGIGGVLEPPGARPVVVEDGCFLGSRAIVVEGVHLEREVVLAANVVLTASTPIIDVSGPTPVEYRGKVPARSVVVPGTRPKDFPAGTYHLACALVIGKRKASTNLRTSLEEALRDFAVPV